MRKEVNEFYEWLIVAEEVAIENDDATLQAFMKTIKDKYEETFKEALGLSDVLGR